MKKGKKNKPIQNPELSPLTSAFYINLGYSEEAAKEMAKLFAEFDEFEREFALDYINDLVAERNKKPITTVLIDGREVPVVEISENGETLFINAYGYEDEEGVSPDDIEIAGPPVPLVKTSPYWDIFRRDGLDDDTEEEYLGKQNGGKKMSMKPVKNSGQISRL